MLELSKCFLQYLKKLNLLYKCHISQLEADFKNFSLSTYGKVLDDVEFYRVVYDLEQSFPSIKVDNFGFVNFTTRSSERSKLFNILRNPKIKEQLIKGNGLIDIFCSSQNCVAANGHFKFELVENYATFIIILKNNGNQPVFLKKCLPLRDMDAFSFHDEGCATNIDDNFHSLEIKPKCLYEIKVKCQIEDDVGRFDTELFFNFHVKKPQKETFRMLRLLTCTKVNPVVEELQPESPYTGREKITSYMHSSTLAGEPITLTGNKLEKSRKLLLYYIPESLKQAVSNKVFTKNSTGLAIQDLEYLKLAHANLCSHNYSKKFSLLLHLEEIQAQKDIRNYDLKKVKLEQTKSGNRYWLKVPGLAEKRPSVIYGDHIYLYELDMYGVSRGVRIEGIVHEVQLDKVLLGLNTNFQYIKGMNFDVVFTFSRFPMQLQHRAISTPLLNPKKHNHILFPMKISVQIPLPKFNLSLYNAKISNNFEQAKAINSIVLGKTIYPYVIYGPPGTGKTVTVVETIKQVVKLNPNYHILVCAPSNSAVDLLAERLLEHVDKNQMFRLCAASRIFESASNPVKEIMNYNLPNREYYFPKKLELYKYNIILTTLITAGRLTSAHFPDDHFNYVFIDEAGYATEPEFMTAVGGLLGRNGRLVLAGDPKQLGPVLFSRLAGLFGLVTSYLERITQLDLYQPNENEEYDCRFITKLVKNYRSHEAILEIPNGCFYDNELEECADASERNLLCNWFGLPSPGFPLIFHSVKGKDQRESKSPSFFNAEEAVVAVGYAKKLLEEKGNGITARSIGIISPYKRQVNKLRQALKKQCPRMDVTRLKIGSVEEFQGQERRVIIISTVRSSNEHIKEDNKFKLGFLNNPKRFNVALTRAKSLLIVVGDPDILCLDYYWNKFINYCVDKGGYVGKLVKKDLLERKENEVAEIDELINRMKMLELEGLQEAVTPRRPEE